MFLMIIYNYIHSYNYFFHFNLDNPQDNYYDIDHYHDAY